MKKKVWIPIVIAVLLAALFIPIPAGVYRDGGTREYRALAYKVVSWKRLSGYEKTKVYFFPNNLKSKSELWQMEADNAEEETSSFLATVLEINGSAVLVEPVEGSDMRNSSDKISFGIAELEKIDAQVGSRVQITYTGGIMESYPAQIHALSWKLADSTE